VNFVICLISLNPEGLTRSQHVAAASVIVGLWLCLAAPAYAQRDLGTVVGTITDPSGAAIPEASIALTEDATGLAYEVHTDAAGRYIRPALKPGVYSVRAGPPGFKTTIQRNVRLSAGERVQVDITLEIGEITESIEVTTAPPALQTESAIIGHTLQSRAVSELPLGGQRRAAFLATLSPGVVPNEPGTRDSPGGSFSANGVRSSGQNNFLFNGVDNNVNVIDFINGAAYVIGPAVEAISEMKVMTNGYNAEYGRAAGGVVNVTLKSGSNDFHGVAHWTLQNELLNANRWEFNKNGLDRGIFKQNQFGANLGGALIKNKLFFFGNYQGIRIRSESELKNFTIPWPEFTQGDFSGLRADDSPSIGVIYDATTGSSAAGIPREPFSDNMIPESRWDSAARNVMAMFPQPNANLEGRVPSNNYVAPLTQSQDVDQGDFRLDYRHSDKDMLFGSISWHEELRHLNSPLPSLLDGTGFPGETQESKPRNGMASWTRVWSPSIITETRLAFTRLVTRRLQANSDVDGYRAVGIGGLNPSNPSKGIGGLPRIVVGGYSGVGASPSLPTEEYSNVWDLIVNMSVTKKGNAMKWGFEYRPIDFPFNQSTFPHGRWQFSRDYTGEGRVGGDGGDGVATLLLGSPLSAGLSTTNTISSQRETYSAYFQDDWKLSPKLTINIGVRYDLFSPISERFGRQANFAYSRMTPTLVIPEGPNQDALLPPNFYAQVAVERGIASKYLIPWDQNNIAPRIGFAYQLTPKSVIRAGYGIFYGGEENEGGAPSRGQSVPFNRVVEITDSNSVEANPYIATLSDGFPLDTLERPLTIRMKTTAENRETPLVHKWNAAVQLQLGWNTVWEVSYVGSHGQHLSVQWSPNIPVNDPRPNLPPSSWPSRQIYTNLIPGLGSGDISESANFGVSNYHGLATKLEKRFSNGLDLLASYTWSHALSTTGSPLASEAVSNTRNAGDIRESYANAPFDIRHRFVTSFLYELPFGPGQRFGSGWNRALDAVLGDWQVNGIVALQTGFAASAQRGGLGFNTSFARIHPDLVPGRDPNDAPPGGRTPEQWWDAAALTGPTMGTWGSLDYMFLRRPGLSNLDISLFKTVPIAESIRLVYRVEFLNAFNTPHFGLPGNQQGTEDFGRISNTASDPRQIQMSLRLQF